MNTHTTIIHFLFLRFLINLSHFNRLTQSIAITWNP